MGDTKWGDNSPKMDYEQRKAYTKAYRKARKTKAGSKKALFGGNVAHKAGKAAARKK